MRSGRLARALASWRGWRIGFWGVVCTHWGGEHIGGAESPQRLPRPAGVRLKAPKTTLLNALTGRVTDHHRFMIKMHLQQIESLEQAVRELEARSDQGPFRA